jgi:hypothetical protein
MDKYTDHDVTADSAGFGPSTTAFSALETYQQRHRYRYEPAKFFEEHSGLTGIAGHYQFPDDPR